MFTQARGLTHAANPVPFGLQGVSLRLLTDLLSQIYIDKILSICADSGRVRIEQLPGPDKMEERRGWQYANALETLGPLFSLYFMS